MNFLRSLKLSLSRNACDEARCKSSLIDDLSGVWVYPSEQLGKTTLFVVQGHKWICYVYKSDRIGTESQNIYDEGEILGSEGVYYFANPTNFYSPNFLIRTANGNQFMISSRVGYDRFKETGVTEVGVKIRVANVFDSERPPARPSIAELGVPYHNRFVEEG